MVKPTTSSSSSTCEKLMFQIGKENEDSKGLPFSSLSGVSRNIPKINNKPAGVKRSCGKNCRIRWNNQQILQIETNFSPEEEDLIIKLHSTIGSRWTIIAQQLPGRTDNEVKNFWNKKLKKKLTAVGIDPITHRPFSQILADYGSINSNAAAGGFTSHGKSRNHHFLGGVALRKTEHHQHHQKQQSSADFNNTHFLDSSKDQFFNGNGNGNGNSFDLLSQLQAIAMVTDYNSSKKNNYNSCCFQEIFVPFPVSDQIQSAANNNNNNNNKGIIGPSATASFSWCDFLLEDEFLPVIDYGEEQEINGGMKFLQGINEEFKKKSTGTGDLEEDYTASSGGGSFVEAILETETDKMLLSDFHGFLDEPF